MSGTSSDARSEARRVLLFGLGDCAFLVVVSVVGVLVMHLAHRAGWGFLPECLAGMAAAMLVQMLLAFLVAPLLGSIESMTPSMPVGMISPMGVCALHLAGFRLTHAGLLALGIVGGLAMFAFVLWYARVCRRSVQVAAPRGRRS